MPASRPTTPSPPAAPWWSRPAPAAVALVVLVIAAYSNSLSAPFLFDDQPGILRNPSIRSLGTALFPPDSASGATGRPLVNLSLALNYALGGLDPRGYHLFNILLHAANALLALGLLRRVFGLPALASRLGAAGPALAAGVALLWALHPLQTESVTCVIQRSELLGGFLYLLAGYGLVRAATGGGRAWVGATVAACTLGPAAKELVATAPVLLFLLDRTLVAGSFREAWRQRGRLHLSAFVGAWLVFGALFLATPNRGGTVGFGLGVSSWDYLLTQCRAIVMYLKLTLCPHPLVVDYGTGVVRTVGEVLPQILLLAALVIGTLLALVRRPMIGFLGAWFFVILAPSSSVVPLTTQTMAEHRMYLPLLPIVLGAALGLWRLRPAVAGLVLTALALAAGTVTFLRNEDYRSAIALWQDTAAKAPDNSRAHYNLGNALMAAGRPADALPAFATAVRLSPDDATIRHNYGAALADVGRSDEAIAQYSAALRLGSDSVDVHTNLGAVLAQAGRLPEAALHYARAVELEPNAADLHSSLGWLLANLGQIDEALAAHRRAVALKPDWIDARVRLADLLLQSGRPAEALREYEAALRLKPDAPELRQRVATLRAAGR